MNGSIIFFSKEKADILNSLGFKYTVHKMSDGTDMFSFIDTPKLRKAIGEKYSSKDFYISNSVFL